MRDYQAPNWAEPTQRSLLGIRIDYCPDCGSNLRDDDHAVKSLLPCPLCPHEEDQ